MDIYAIQDEVTKRQLNLEKIFKLSDTDKSIIMNLFTELVDSFYGEKGISVPGGMRIDAMRAIVIYNTLVDNDYLVTKREASLDKVLS